MHVEVRKKGDVVVADLNGRLVGGVGDEILREVVNELLAEGWKKILLNLSGVQVVDSAGIGELVACHKRAVEKGGAIKILKPNEKLLDLFTITKLIEIFDIFKDEKEALKAF